MRAGATTRFPWGETPDENGHPGLNYWEGATHAENPGTDGWIYLSPVHTYPPNRWGFCMIRRGMSGSGSMIGGRPDTFSHDAHST